MAISRTRSAGAKVTDDEYRQLEILAQTRGLTVGEWCREVLLAQCSEPSTTVPEQTILSEVLGVRMIVINLFRALGKGELSQETLEAVIRRADSEKLPTALERVAQAATPGTSRINSGLFQRLFADHHAQSSLPETKL